MARTKAELLMKIQELESTIWDGTRQLYDLQDENERLRAALKRATELCARPLGVCFDLGCDSNPPENGLKVQRYDGTGEG